MIAECVQRGYIVTLGAVILGVSLIGIVYGLWLERKER